MSHGSFTPTLTSGQYVKGNYTAPDGTIRTGFHIFTVHARTRQRITPIINLSERIGLGYLNPNSSVASSADVIAKINGNVFNYNVGPIGINYEGANGNLYIGAYRFNSPPTDSTAYTNIKFSPSFCVKSNGDAVIRWFDSATKLQAAMNACDCIIAGAHAIVFNGKCTTDENVYDNETDPKLIYNATLPSNQTNTRWDTGVNQSSTALLTARRTCLGHKANSNGVYIMVCTDSSVSLHEMANFMKLQNCDYAINLDGSSSVQMRIKEGYGESGVVTSGSGVNLYAGVAAYLV